MDGWMGGWVGGWVDAWLAEEVYCAARLYPKTLQPRNLVTDSGEGWAASMTQCRLRLITLPFF